MPLPRDPRDYTPRHLADKILQSKSALEGERKQVTVLFADVKGSLELAESVDPEEWHRILDRFFQILADGVHRFEGTVNQYTGDGIMALFGAPIAHEDHAQRACYAALHLRDALRRYADELRLERGLNFSVRMGINSGEVIVGKIGDDLRMDYTAQGQTVGLAARMEQLAEPGKTLLTEHTAKLAAGFFELRDLGASKIRGLAEALHVFELEGAGRARTRLDVSRARGFSKFVGRDDDMQTLEAALARSREGNGQVVGVVSEAGIGKSRLCYEFIERCRARGLTVLEGHAVAHGKNVPFLPILQVFRAYFGITEQDDDRTGREKIAGRLLLIEEGIREVLPVVFEFFGVADPEQSAPRMDPEARQRQLFGVMRRVVQEESRGEPAVTLIEDLHWMDGGSLAFLEQWVDAVPGGRGLLLVNFRSEYHADWMQKSYYQQLPLAPLGPEATRELLSDFLGDDPSTAGLAETIHERTAGNPFFIEEVVQSLVESGHLEGTRGSYRLVSEIGVLDVPATVQAALAARIDRLPEREKQVLQAASVIGKEFTEPVIEAVAELPAADLAESLHALASAEFLYEQSLYPVAEYAFRHALTQEVAYQSQLTQRRAQVHGAVARTIAELYPDRLDEQAALIAHHWEEAGEAPEAAQWHRRAADWAGTSHLAEALRHWRKVRALLEKIPESAETTALGVAARTQLLNIGWRLGASEEEAAGIFAEGKALAQRSGDLRSLALLISIYSAVRGFAGDGEAQLHYSTEGARLADQSEDGGLILACRLSQLVAYWYAGRLPEAIRLAEQVVAGTPEDPRVGADILGFGFHILALMMSGLIVSATGRHGDAEANLDQAVQLARQHGDTENLGWAHAVHGWVARNTGTTEPALGHARQAIEIAEKSGSPFSRVLAYEHLGHVYVLAEEWSQAAGALERALEIARETRTGLLEEAFVLADLSQAYLGLGDNRRARATADDGVAVARRRGTKLFECVAHITRARVLLRTDGATASGDIHNALREAQTLLEETGGRSQEPFIHEELAELARLTGDDATCRNKLREAHRLFTEMGATGHAKRLTMELGL